MNSEKVRTRTERERERLEQPYVLWGSSSEAPGFDAARRQAACVEKQKRVWKYEGLGGGGVMLGRREVDGLHCHLPLCDLRPRGC